MTVTTGPATTNEATTDAATGTRRPRRTTRGFIRRHWLSVLSPLVALALWEFASRSGMVSPVLFPPPSAIAVHAVEVLTSEPEFGGHIWATVRRLLLTAGIAAVAGILVGTLITVTRFVGTGVENLLAFIFPVPSLLFLPMITFLVGRTETALLLTAAVTPVLIMVNATVFGMRQIDRSLVEAGRHYGARGTRFFSGVLLPGAMAAIVPGFRVALGFSLITVVALEMVMSETGLGAVLWLSWRILQVQDMYVALLVVAILGLLVTRGLNAVMDRLAPWQATGNTP
ncbi:ABC transporter permease [Modestobacter lapidis]|nr:ABC transporter permease [Modestobacter lapidis]